MGVTYTKQDTCMVYIGKNKPNIAKITPSSVLESQIYNEIYDQMAILMDNIMELKATLNELKDFYTVVEKFYGTITQQTKKEEFIGKGRCIL